MRIYSYIGRYAKVAAMMVVAALVMTSCSEETWNSPWPGREAEGTKTLQFTLELPTINGTRTTPVGAYDDGRGTAWENYINISEGDFRFYLFSAGDSRNEGGILIAALEAIEISAAESAASTSKYYTVTATLEDVLPEDFKVVAFANNVRYPSVADLHIGTTTLQDLAQMVTYDYLDESGKPFEPDMQRGIPMFGVMECEGFKPVGNMLNHIGTMHMLRAMSKIEVSVEPDSGQALEWVVLKGYNTGGYTTPGLRDFKEAEYVKGNWKEDYGPGVNLIGGRNMEGSSVRTLSFRKSGATGEEVYTIYVPEYRNVAGGVGVDIAEAAEDASYMELKFAGDAAVRRLDFKYYSAEEAEKSGARVGDAFDLQRNYYYCYRVNLSGSELNWILDVEPYTGVNLDVGVGMLLPSITLNHTTAQLYNTGADHILLEAAMFDGSKTTDITTESRVMWTLYSGKLVEVTDVTVEGRAYKRLGIKAGMLDIGTDLLTVSYPYENPATGEKFTIEANCIVIVGGPRIILDQTYMGMLPGDEKSLNVQIIAPQGGTVTWEIQSAEDGESNLLEGEGMTTAEMEGAGLLTEGGRTLKVRSLDKEGKGIVYVRYNVAGESELTAWCDVTITRPHIVMKTPSLEMAVGMTLPVTAELQPLFYDRTPRLQYRSTDESVAMVDETGIVTAVGGGKCQIIVYNTDAFGTLVESEACEVTVSPYWLKLSQSQIEIADGTTYQLTARLMPEGSIAGRMTWTSGNTYAATVSGTGLVTADMSRGHANWDSGANRRQDSSLITVSTTTPDGNRVEADCLVVVTQDEYLVFEQTYSELRSGQDIVLTAHAFPVTGHENLNLRWSVNNTRVARVENSTDRGVEGLLPNQCRLTTIGPGTVTVTVTTESPHITTGRAVSNSFTMRVK